MNKKELRIVILTTREPYISEKLIQSGYSVVGLSGIKDGFLRLNGLKKLIWYFLIYLFRDYSRFLSIYAKNNEIKYHEYNKSCIDDFKVWLKDLKPHILLLDSAPIVPSDIFSIPSIGTINNHTSTLPRYRGVNPTFWLYYNMEFDAGVTIHYVDEKIDTGNIIAQKILPIKPGTNGISLEYELSTKHAYSLIEEFFEKIIKNDHIEGETQPVNSPTPYARKLSDHEYYELLTDHSVQLERFWHILHANNQWKNVFIGHDSFSRYFDWELGRFSYSNQNEPFYKFRKINNQHVITHPDGLVLLKKKYNFKKFIRSFL